MLRFGIILFTLLSFQVRAEFGFGPCCSGAMCGVVPCDTSCAGAALEDFGGKFSNLLSSLEKGHNNLTTELENSASTSKKFFDKLSDNEKERTAKSITILDAGSRKLTAKKEQVNYILPKVIDTVVRNFNRAYKDQSLLNAYIQNDEYFGVHSRPSYVEALIDSWPDNKLILQGANKKYHQNASSLYILRKSLSDDEKSGTLSKKIYDMRDVVKEFDEASSYRQALLTSSINKGSALRDLKEGYLTSLEDENAHQSLEKSINRNIYSVSYLNEVIRLNEVGLKRNLSINNQLTNYLLKDYLELKNNSVIYKSDNKDV